MPLLPKFDLKLDVGYSDYMTKEQLIDIIKRVLETDADLDFLDKLSNSELETFVAVMRDRIEHPG